MWKFLRWGLSTIAWIFLLVIDVNCFGLLFGISFIVIMLCCCIIVTMFVNFLDSSLLKDL